MYWVCTRYESAMHRLRTADTDGLVQMADANGDGAIGQEDIRAMFWFLNVVLTQQLLPKPAFQQSTLYMPSRLYRLLCRPY